jgi:hypothetical protein
LTNSRDKSPDECRDGSFFLKKFLCLEVMGFIEKYISSIFVDEGFDHWPTEIISENIVDHGTKISTCRSCQEYEKKIHFSSLYEYASRDHRDLRWKWDKA